MLEAALALGSEGGKKRADDALDELPCDRLTGERAAVEDRPEDQPVDQLGVAPGAYLATLDGPSDRGARRAAPSRGEVRQASVRRPSCAILTSPLRQSVPFARQIITPDHLGGGRVTIGVAVDGYRDEFEVSPRTVRVRPAPIWRGPRPRHSHHHPASVEEMRAQISAFARHVRPASSR